MKSLWRDWVQFLSEFLSYLSSVFNFSAVKVSKWKGVSVTALYKQRGKLARRLMHSGMAGVAAFGAMVAPIVAQEFPRGAVDPWSASSPAAVLSASTSDTSTDFSGERFRGEITEYKIEEGDTVGSIAQKFGVDADTIRWQNGLSSKDSIKAGQVLEILPVLGIAHKVKKGDTVYSIAKRYDVDPQEIVNYPYNSFSNDETFELAVGQTLIVPNGVMPAPAAATPVRIRQITPDAGTVVASGQFVWPTNGHITQNFVWYHKGLDIANKAAPSVLAADSGTVVATGWDSYGYGNRIIVDHGNGFKTLYAHLQKIYVVAGQTVGRGAALGQMGSSGRSTGTHLHFEVIQNGVHISPLNVLR